MLFYDIFAHTKNSSFEVSDDVIACDLWFGPLPIKNPGYAYDLKYMEAQEARQFKSFNDFEF